MNYKKYMALAAVFWASIAMSMQESIKKNKNLINAYLNERSKKPIAPTVNGYEVFTAEDDYVISIYGEKRPCGQLVTALRGDNNKQIADSAYSIYAKDLDQEYVIDDIIQQVNIKESVLRELLKDVSVVVIIETLWVDLNERAKGTGTKYFAHNAAYFAHRYEKNCLLLGKSQPYGAFERLPQKALNMFYTKCECTVLDEEHKDNKYHRGQPFYMRLLKEEIKKPCWMIRTPLKTQNIGSDIKINYVKN